MEKEKQENGRFGLIYPNSAAVDVGSMEMYVSMPNAEGTSTVKVFKAFTEDINGLVQELKQAQVTRVAMEATGVYWMAIFEMLEQAGLQVTLVNAHHFKNTDAQKTDVKDCQWLHQLHEHGLLRASHVASRKLSSIAYLSARTQCAAKAKKRWLKSDTTSTYTNEFKNTTFDKRYRRGIGNENYSRHSKWNTGSLSTTIRSQR